MPHLLNPITAKDHLRGNPDAKMILIEYGDFQCPFCGKAYFILRELQQALKEKVLFVFRNFPLKQAHPLAVMAAELAESASLQDKFWEMHDYIYEHQNHLNEESPTIFSGSLNLNLQKIHSDMHSPEVKNKIEEDFKGGILSGVNGTPCFYINGERYDGGISFDDLLQALS